MTQAGLKAEILTVPDPDPYASAHRPWTGTGVLSIGGYDLQAEWNHRGQLTYPLHLVSQSKQDRAYDLLSLWTAPPEPVLTAPVSDAHAPPMVEGWKPKAKRAKAQGDKR